MMENSVDVAYLKSFTGADDTLVKRLLESFIRNIPGQLQELKNYIVENDMASIPSAAHKLKSPFRYIGRSEIADRLEVIENEAVNLNRQNLLNEIDELVKIGNHCVLEAQGIVQNMN